MTSPGEPRKVAIVTGASRGIGAGIAQGFLGIGYRVVASSRSIPYSHGTDVHTVQGDISHPETAQRIVHETLDHFGRIDTLINNAGIFIGKPFLDYIYDDDYVAMTAVNLGGFFHLTQRVVRHMTEQAGGHVVNITTSLVDHARVASPSALSALTKGGLDAATRSLATEFAARGVRFNAVAPGVVKTSTVAEADYEELAAQHPLGRMAEISDIVQGVIYLEQASFVTGETLHIDGGQAVGH
jgi:NAD(P)-dependent dehydrogenase (short-subunit alcohol dehydrogenase family)